MHRTEGRSPSIRQVSAQAIILRSIKRRNGSNQAPDSCFERLLLIDYSVVVYAGDPWYPAADASINNFYIKPLNPIRGCVDHTACNADDHASIDDGSCQVRNPHLTHTPSPFDPHLIPTSS